MFKMARVLKKRLVCNWKMFLSETYAYEINEEKNQLKIFIHNKKYLKAYTNTYFWQLFPKNGEFITVWLIMCYGYG